MILNPNETNDLALQNLGSNLDHVTELQTDDIAFLKRIFRSKQINAIFKIYNKIERKAIYKKYTPVLSAAVHVIIDVLDLLVPYSHQSKDIKELFQLLQKPHIQGLICAHDSVAQKEFQPHLPELTFDFDDEESLKIVQLVKTNDPIKGDVNGAEPIVGATIKNDDETGKIVFARIFAGGVADRSGLINVGDEIVEVNNTSVVDKTPNDILNILRNSDATITFKLIPVGNKSRVRESKTRVRAFFDYCAANDSFIPCKVAGLDFKRGDILHIVSQDDSYWWQAKKESDPTNTVGLIPSRALQEKRIVYEKNQPDTSNKTDCFSSSNEDNCISTSTQKVKKIMYNCSNDNEDFDRGEIATYEEVAKLFPVHSPRPIVLIGAPGIGKNELRRRLIAKHQKRYVSPIAHTTRDPKPEEIDGVDYIFITREQMEKDIENGQFIEYGEYKNNLYGTSKESVQSIVQLGQVCVLCPHYRALKTIRSSTLKPFVIFVKCPELEVLKSTRAAFKARSTFDVASSRAFTDDEFDTILEFSNRIETLYNHWFDAIVVNDDLYRTVAELNGLVEQLEKEPSWVPVSWVQ